MKVWKFVDNEAHYGLINDEAPMNNLLYTSKDFVNVMYQQCMVITITSQTCWFWADDFGITNVCDFVLLMRFMKLIILRHFLFYSISTDNTGGATTELEKVF